MQKVKTRGRRPGVTTERHDDSGKAKRKHRLDAEDIEGLPEVELRVTGQKASDLYQDVQAAPCVGHFILHTHNTTL